METGIEGQPFSPITENSKENIIELFKDKDADLIAFGHNHQMHLYDDNKTIYFNPGAVGLNNGANAVYGIVTINDNEFSIERIKLPYDNEEYLQGFDENKCQRSNSFLNIFISCKNRVRQNSIRIQRLTPD